MRPRSSIVWAMGCTTSGSAAMTCAVKPGGSDIFFAASGAGTLAVVATGRRASSSGLYSAATASKAQPATSDRTRTELRFFMGSEAGYSSKRRHHVLGCLRVECVQLRHDPTAAACLPNFATGCLAGLLKHPVELIHVALRD